VSALEDLSRNVLYCGDGTLEGSAAYLSAVMDHFGIHFNHVPPDRSINESFGRFVRSAERSSHSLIVLSDYPAAAIDLQIQRRIADLVAGGCGLLMIGGWSSFHGVDGYYDGTLIGELLPVEIATDDDRLNTSSPCLVVKEMDHPVIDGLPLGQPPSIAGLNRVSARKSSRTVLSAAIINTGLNERGEIVTAERERLPLLVFGSHEKGRTAAYASDVAPHWAGGFIDWGEERIQSGSGSAKVEIGLTYATFFRNLLLWTSEPSAGDSGAL